LGDYGTKAISARTIAFLPATFRPGGHPTRVDRHLYLVLIDHDPGPRQQKSLLFIDKQPQRDISKNSRARIARGPNYALTGGEARSGNYIGDNFSSSLRSGVQSDVFPRWCRSATAGQDAPATRRLTERCCPSAASQGNSRFVLIVPGSIMDGAPSGALASRHCRGCGVRGVR
jgi:hypothetical protein